MHNELSMAAEDFLVHLAVEKGRALNTLDAYRRDLRTYFSWLGDRSVTDVGLVTADDIVDFTRFLQDGSRAPASQNRIMAAVRGLHRFLVVENVVQVDPTADVEAARLPRGLPKALSEPQITSLIDAVEGDDPVSLRDRAILETLYGTGMRITELVSLSLEDVDLSASLIRVTGKGNKQRLVPVGRLAQSALEAWLEPGGRRELAPSQWANRDDEAAVFLNQRGGRLSRQGGWLVVRKHGMSVGLADQLSPHVLRHSCATHMLDHGADIRTVQELLGHASVTTTQLYTKVSTDLMVREYSRAHPRALRRPGSAT